MIMIPNLSKVHTFIYLDWENVHHLSDYSTHINIAWGVKICNSASLQEANHQYQIQLLIRVMPHCSYKLLQIGNAGTLTSTLKP